MTFTVLASVAAIAAVPVAATPALALSVTAISSSSQVTAALAPEDPPKSEYGGQTVDQVLGDMREAISRVKDGIRAQETKIADALRAAVSIPSDTP